MQVICTLALHHPLTAVSHEVTPRYVEQMQHSSLSCSTVGHTLSSMSLTDNMFPSKFIKMYSIVVGYFV